MEINIPVLIQNIQTAFKSEKIPTNVSDGCTREICKEIEIRYQGISIEKLNSDDIYFLSKNSVLLNPDAFRYYIQPLLMVALKDPTKVDIDSLIQNFFLYPGMNDYMNYNKDRLDRFTEEEAQVVELILEYWFHSPEIDQNWKNLIEKSIPYWKKKADKN